jgi:hypothetical protein
MHESFDDPDERFVFDAETQKIIERGKAAWKRLEDDETWSDWIATGEAFKAGRDAIRAKFFNNDPNPSGKRWADIFGDWLKESGFARIKKSTRSRLLDCIENRPAIDAWRAKIGARAFTLNHPEAVLRRWKAETQDTVEQPPKKNSKDEEIRRLLDENDSLRRQLDDVQGWKDYAAPDEMATGFAAALIKKNPEVAEQAANLVVQQVNDLLSKQKPRRKKTPIEHAADILGGGKQSARHTVNRSGTEAEAKPKFRDLREGNHHVGNQVNGSADLAAPIDEANDEETKEGDGETESVAEYRERHAFCEVCQRDGIETPAVAVRSRAGEKLASVCVDHLEEGE